MKVGVISDIHGNFPALQAVFDSFPDSLDLVVCLGDIVGVLGWNNECVSMVKNRCDSVVVGNHDRRVIPSIEYQPKREYDNIEYNLVTSQLSEEQVSWLASQPEDQWLPEPEMRLVHSHPLPYVRWDGDDRVEPRSFTKMGDFTRGGILCLGHTHKQHAVDISRFEGQEGVVVNPGSVGVPYYKPAEFAIVNTDDFTWELNTVEYEYTNVEKRLKELGVYKRLKNIHNATRPVRHQKW